MKRAAIAAVFAIGVAATPALADYYYDDGPGFAATPFGPDFAPGYGYHYYRGGPCVTDEGGGRLMPCDYGGGSGG
jgi:hypothetical protein